MAEEPPHLPESSGTARSSKPQPSVKDTRLTVICPDNRTFDLVLKEKMSVMDVLSTVVPGDEQSFVLESFGKVYKTSESVFKILENTNANTLLLSDIHRPYPVARDNLKASEDTSQKAIRHVHAILLRGEYPDYAFIFEVDPVAETLAIRDCTAKVRTTYKYGGQGWQEGWEKMIGILDAWEAKQGRRFKSWRCLIDIAASLWE